MPDDARKLGEEKNQTEVAS